MVESPRRCLACGSHNLPDARFCSACGGALPDEASVPVSGTATQARRFDLGLLGTIGIAALLVCGAVVAAVFVSGRLTPGTPETTPGLALAIPTATATATATERPPAQSPAAVATAQPASSPSPVPAPSPVGPPAGYAVKFCAAYGTYNSASLATSTGLQKAFAAYSAGSLSATKVVSRIKSFDADLAAAAKSFSRLPTWAPGDDAASEFRQAISAYRAALKHFSAGMKRGSQAEFDRGTDAIGAIADPMTAGYGATVVLARDYGIACSREGLPAGNEANPPTTSGVVGTPVTTNGQIVTVEKVEQWGGMEFLEPEPGNAYVTVFVDVTATKKTFVNLLGLEVQAADGTTYSATPFGAREPQISVNWIAKGKSRSGWLTFEVPRAVATNLTLLWVSGLADQPVEIALY